MLDPVEGSFGPLADEVEWEEISLPGETHDLKMSVKRLLLPNPDVEEVRRGPGNPIPARTDDVDRLWYVIDGEMTMNGHRMTRGSTLFVRKGEPYDCSGTGPEGVRYLRVKLMDEKGMDARLG
jgi:mannose-6-phosphate isomerase-like protein (cupin superfamily)